MAKKIEVKSKENLFYAIVDDSDYDRLSKMKWRAWIDRVNGVIYAVCKSHGNGVFMHREIMGNPTAMMIDHKDGNGLNNRRCNLRVCTNSQNQCNSRLRRTSRSGYKGVCFRGNRIVSRIKVNGTSIYLGSFSTREEAARAYNRAARHYHGEFARLNDI